MKKNYKKLIFLGAFGLFFSCTSFAQDFKDSLKVNRLKSDTTILLSDTVKPIFIPHKNSQQVDNLINYAKQFLGTPYRYSGTTPSGFDCSGFISYIFGNFGVELIHSSYGMAEFGKTVKLSEIRAGDLMFFKGSSVSSSKIGHVAMVVEVTPDAINFIHSSTSRGVVIENFKKSKYFIPRYVTTKRLDYGVTDEEKSIEPAK